MKTLLTLLLTIGMAQAQMKGDTYYLPAVDVGLEKEVAAERAQGQPLKYALGTPIEVIHHSKHEVGSAGQWTQMFDGSWEFRIRLSAENATSINVGMVDFFLPHSAELWVYSDDESIMRGPYNDTYNQSHGFFWIGDVPGDHVNLKLTVNNREKQYLSFQVNNITRGFYKYWEEPSYLAKSGSCNVDVACPEADGWDDPINSVGQYSFSTSEGGFVCTGQLINNTAQDGTPYFLTADHCGYSNESTQEPLTVRQNVAASISLTWNYQSLTCRAPGSASSGNQISRSGFNDRQSGTTYLASNPDSDFTLLELNQTPPDHYGVVYTGWDRSAGIPSGVVSIHHPAGHAKRISIENDPLTITGRGSVFPGNQGYFRIGDWDVGTTEGGSSGGGLWNSDQLLVGQLFGGLAACGNDEADWYGRFHTSWDNGSDAQSRLSDWLDPQNTGQITLGSSEGCEAPTVSIVNNSSNQVGDNLTFTAQASGGAGNYTFIWDIDGDGVADDSGSSIQANYNQSYVGNINVTVTDADNCQGRGSQAVVIEAANIQLEEVVNIRENLDQICGNNDNVIDPGERWTTLLQARNTGGVTGTDAYLAMGKSRQADIEGINDSFGNVATSCNRLFIDISSTGTMMPWESANVGNTNAEDEGSVLIQLANPFQHYGETVTQVRASTNGFISTSSNATGGDWDNDCPLPQTPDKDNEGARIAVMHDDLRDATFYHQSFNSCPRPSDTGGDLACEVFMWQSADLWDTMSTVENYDIQAILYPATSQWVYQYGGSGFNGSGASVGMQNEAATDGLNYACNSSNGINTTEAVCLFNRDHKPSSDGAPFVMLESPVISIGDMDVNEAQSGSLDFAIAEDATCGTQFAIDHQASVFDEGFNTGQNNVFNAEVGNNGQCRVVTNCGVGSSTSFSSNDIQVRPGLWWNPSRNGNGFDWYNINQRSLVYNFYTGEKTGEPVWYLANDTDSKHNQYYNNIFRFEAPGGFGNGELSPDNVGWSNTTFIDDSNAIQVRTIKGDLSAEKLYFLQYGANETPNYHTGLYFTPSENGWGHSVGTLGNSRVVVTYLYRDDGQPYWTIASGPNNSSLFDVYYFNTFCPSCPATNTPGEVVGSLSLNLNNGTDGTLTQFNVVHDMINWTRSNLPVVNLLSPQN